MPETAVDKHGDVLQGKGEVRPTRDRIVPTPAGDAVPQQKRAEHHLGIPVPLAGNP
jgi:hypothetical protein